MARRYETIAAAVERMITTGVLPAGERTPSIRELHRTTGASISTVLHAYRVLEDRGLIRSRPGAGYYVSAATLPRPSTPTGVSRRVAHILESVSNPACVPLACAIPSAELLPTRRLAALLAGAARRDAAASNAYSFPSGYRPLRERIARRAGQAGHMLHPDEVLITCGAIEALGLALGVSASPGDLVAVESPCYFGILQILESQGLEVLELPADPGAGLDVAALDRAAGERRIAACVATSGFHNPLGTCLAADAADELVRVCAHHGIVLIDDDVYGDLHHAAERPQPFAARPDAGHVIHCGSFSKILAPGYRIGWAASSQFHERLTQRKYAQSICSAALPQMAISDYVGSRGFTRHLAELRRVCAGNIERATQLITAHFPAGTRVEPPRGGFLVWVQLPEPVDTDRLFGAALAEGIAVAPGSMFSAAGRYRNCMRLSVGMPWSARVSAAICRVGALANQLVGTDPAGTGAASAALRHAAGSC